MTKAYEVRDNSLTLFPNDRKDKPNQPDYRGDGMVNGVPVKLSGWKKTGKNGVFLSLAVQNKDQPAPGNRDIGPGRKAEESWSEDLSDSIPF